MDTPHYYFKIFYIFFFLCFLFCGCADSRIYFGGEAGFSFKKLQTKEKIIYSEDILTQIQSNVRGYFLKNIIFNKNAEKIAKIHGQPPDLSIHIRKTGNFSATLVLGHKKYPDAIIENCYFQINSYVFTFSKILRNSRQSKIIKSSEILSRIPEEDKKGYTLKNILLDREAKSKKLATIGGVQPYLQINLEKIGRFTATLILEHKFYLDVILKNAPFEYRP